MKNATNILAAIAFTTLTTISHASDIEFEISGINSDNGKLYIQLFKGETNYQQGKAESASIIKASTGTTKVLFNNIEDGEYALRFFHDENNNGQLETNLFGIPVEGYGYSNDAKPNFGPVSYSEIKFLVAADSQKVINQTTAIY